MTLKYVRAIATLGLMTLPLVACNPFDSSLVSACEDALLERLKAPSSYKRIKVEETSEVIPIEVYIREDRPGGGEALKGLFKTANRYVARFSYDAQNGFGANLRGSAACVYTTTSDSASAAAIYSVKIDGKTNAQWMVDSLNR